MPNRQQDKSFAGELNSSVSVILSDSALDIAIDWIGMNLNPDEVFSEKDLKEWAENNGYIKE